MGRTKKAQFPCGECARKTKGTGCLYCEVCNQWFHVECQRVSKTDFENWKRVNGDFLCHACRSDGLVDTFDFLRGLSRLEKAAKKGSSDLRAAIEVEKLLFGTEVSYSETRSHQFEVADVSRVDQIAEDIRLRFTSEDGTTLKATADGDCLFNSISTQLIGNETLCVELRYRTVLMMEMEETEIKNHKNKGSIFWISPDYEEALQKCAIIGQMSSLWTIMALAKVIRRPVKMVYPSVNGTKDLYYKTCNAVFNGCADGPPIVIMWTTLHKPSQRRKIEWRPDHFVPIVTNKMPDVEPSLETLSPIPECSANDGHDTLDDSSDCVQFSSSETQKQNIPGGTEVPSDHPVASSTGKCSSTPTKDMWETPKRKRRSSNSSYVSSETSVNLSNIYPCLIDSEDSEDHDDGDDLGDSEDTEPQIPQNPSRQRQRKLDTSLEVVNTSNKTEDNVTAETAVSKDLHPLPDGKSLQAMDILNEIVGDNKSVKKVPCGNKSNVYVILDNKENMNLIRNKKPPSYWDDCGAWDYKKTHCIKTHFLHGETETDGGHKLSHVLVKSNHVYVEAREKGKKINKLFDPQPEPERILTFHRNYSVSKSDPTFKRRVTWVEGLRLDFPGLREVAIVEYTGEFKESQAPHGNSKKTDDRYERTDPVVINKIKQNVKHQNPSDVYQQMTDPDLNTTADHPRDLRQCQNAKASVTQKQTTSRPNNVADELLEVIRMLTDGHPFVAEIIHSRGNPLPNIICYTQEQITDFKSFLMTKEGIVGVDRTFSLGKCFVTTSVYKSHKVVRKGTGEPPILLGPILLHWDGV